MTKIINKQLIEANIDFRELTDQIEKYYRLLKDGTVVVTTRTFTPTVEGGKYITGAAHNTDTESFITMAQPVMPWFGEKGLPVATTSYMYSSFRTGELKAVVSGADLVKFRTPAKSALAAKYLAAKKEEYTLGIIGLGIQAVTHAQAFAAHFNITRVVVTSKDPTKRTDRIHQIESSLGIDVEVLSKADVIAASDILVVLTSATEPLVNFADLHPGQLVIGTDHAETVARDVVLNADKVFVDYRPTAENEVAAVKLLLADGHKYEDIVDGDLLELASDESPGRTAESEIIFFQSLGVLNENLAAVEYLYEKTKDQAPEMAMD